MFTGIVKEISKVQSIAKSNSNITLGIKSDIVFKDANISDSISINGVCLTLVGKKNNILFFESISSTLKHTTIKRLKKGELINLEPALSVGEKLGGHFVLGHVDCELKLKRKVSKTGFWELEIELPNSFRKSIIENGSIAIDGISLTVKKILQRTFTVNIIPFTYKSTTLQYKKSSDYLNIEFDYLLKKKT